MDFTIKLWSNHFLTYRVITPFLGVKSLGSYTNGVIISGTYGEYTPPVSKKLL